MASTDSEKNIKRRRILKAAASAPVVFTLPMGTALAANSISCAVKSADRAANETVAGVTTAPDAWMRFSLPGFTINQSGGPVSGFNFDGRWFRVNGDGSVTVVTPNGTPRANGVTYYALVDYEAYSLGQPASMYVYTGTPIDNPIAGASCWNSLEGTALTGNVIN